MPLGLQAKLLRVLQEREVERLGGRGSVALDVRVIATTNRRLRQEVAAGRFREDLYYRLNVFPLHLLPLRDRRDDMLPIAMQLLAARVQPGRTPIPALSADSAHALLVHSWPGNVRELDNVLQRALILCTGPVIEPEHLELEAIGRRTRPDDRDDPAMPTAASRGRTCARSLERAERELLLEALRDPQSTRQAVAERLGISPRTLRYKLARLRAAGVEVPGGLTPWNTDHEPDGNRPGAVADPRIPHRGGAAAGHRRHYGARRDQRVAGIRELRMPCCAMASIRSMQRRTAASQAAVANFEQGKPGADLPQVMLEMQKASVSFRAAVEVRNKLVTAYQEIMNMPV